VHGSVFALVAVSSTKKYNLMKNTQKKLKAKHFRYLSQDYIDNPMQYLDDFFVQETYIHYLLMDINLLINAASSVKMNYPYSNSGYNTKKLITLVEIAYVIFKKCELKKLKKPLSLIQCDSDYWNYVSGERLTVNDIESPTDGISRFFSHQSLRQWYETLDAIWINISDRNGEFLGNEGEEILSARELLQRLALSLHKIHESKMLPHNVVQNQENIENGLRQPQQSLEERKDKIFHPKERIILPSWLASQPYSISALKDFFDKEDLNGWRENIRYWYHTVIDEKEFWSADNEISQHSGANLLFNYACIYSLLEMLSNKPEESPSLPISMENSFSILPECQSILIRHAQEQMILYYVSNEELDNPLAALLATVGTYNQQEWNEILYEWINYGLAKNRYTGTFSDYSTRIYQIMIKIIELAYLTAFSEEIEFPNQKQTALLEAAI
jgi:hypothetical protein